jgi:L-arabinose isomerase
MGDFAVTQETFERVLGLRVDQVPATDLASEVAAVTPAQIEAELRADVQRFTPDIPAETHRRSVRVGLGLRQRLDGGGYSAFSLNFLAFDTAEGPVDTVPFLEASKAMARGLGYAGEGDVLTAALVGALNRAFGRTTFTEIFCPDWAGNALFLSHMGEINPEVVGGPARLCERPFPFTKAQRPAIVTGAPRPGPATLVNLSPGPDDTFRLLIVPVEVLADTANPAMRGIVRGWIRPSGPVPQFLERYSELGGTHHSALVLGHHTEALTAFAEYRGWEPALVG